MSFFHVRLRRRLVLRSACSRRGRSSESEAPSPSYGRLGGDILASSGDRCDRFSALSVGACPSDGNGVSSSVGDGIPVTVPERGSEWTAVVASFVTGFRLFSRQIARFFYAFMPSWRIMIVDITCWQETTGVGMRWRMWLAYR